MTARSGTQGTRSIATRFLVDLLEARGVATRALLEDAGLRRDELAGELLTPWPAFAELWRRAAAVEPAVGLRLCERFPEGQMHVLTHLALRSASVGAALVACARYFGAVSPAESVTVDATGDRVVVGYALAPGFEAIPWLVEHYFSLAAHYFHYALGRPLPIVAVAFRAARQAPAAEYERRFGVAPRFDLARDALELDRACWDWPLPTRDEYLSGILERVAAEQAARAAPAGWAARTARTLTQRLLEGGTPTLGATAKTLAVSAATLRARLHAEGTNFRELLDDTRRSLAREHLARGMSATSVAYLLGFSEPAAFQHACRRWFGVPAGAVRRRSM